MLQRAIDLYNYFGLVKPENANGSTLNCLVHNDWLADKRLHPAMLVIPGGAYAFVCPRESLPIAEHFYNKGYNTFYIEYSCGDGVRYPTALFECAMALIFISENAKEFNVDNEHKCAIGFSAGGHLVGELANLDVDRFDVFSDEQKKMLKFQAVIYGYPVVSVKNGVIHNDSFKNLLKDKYDQLINTVSLENNVKVNTCPAFIFHCEDDPLVSYKNAILLLNAYLEKNIPVEFHLFPKGRHGVTLPDLNCWQEKEMSFVNERLSVWTQLVDAWLVELGFNKYKDKK